MKCLLLLACHAGLVLPCFLLVGSESQFRQRETLPETIEHWQKDDFDADLKHGLKEWRTQRMETVKTLKELRDKLDILTVGANYGKGTGYGVQIIGTVTSIVGSFMELAGLPDFQSIMGIGDLVYHSGSVVDGVSSITEYFGSAKYLNNIEKVLKKDKKSSESLGNTLKAWKLLDEEIHEIFGLDVASEKWLQLERFLYEFVRVRSVTRDFQKTIDFMKSGKYSTFLENQVMSGRLLKISNYFAKNTQIATEIRKGITSAVGIASLVKYYKKPTGKEISEKWESLPQKYKAPTMDTVAEYSFMRSIDVAVNFMSLLDVAKVIQEGKSKYSDSLKKIIDILELEAKNIDVL